MLWLYSAAVTAIALSTTSQGATDFTAKDIAGQGTARSAWVLIASVNGDDRSADGSLNLSFLDALPGRLLMSSVDNGKLSFSSPGTPYLVLVLSDGSHDWYALRGHLWQAHNKLKRAGAVPGAGVVWTPLPAGFGRNSRS